MGYILKQFDTPLLRFSVVETIWRSELRIDWVNEDRRALLPLDLALSPEDLSEWLRRRVIPGNRANADALLKQCGLNLRRPLDIVAFCRGLSLNDSYWVVEDGFDGSFDEYNLYENRFSRALGRIAFTGEGGKVPSAPVSSPELTTNGMLPKCWRRVDGRVRLYKGGTSGASNAGFEPYSEYYAAQIAEAMGINAVRYGLSKWEGLLCSTCALFTGREFSFMPVGRLVTRGGFPAVIEYYEALGQEYLQALRDMVVFDAVTCNTDRHFGNFGFMIDNATNRIAAPAPLFDHGNALFNYAGPQYMSGPEVLREYADGLVPCVYEDHVRMARALMNESNREQLRRLTAFRFRRHPRYNLPEKWLELIEGQVQRRIGQLTEEQ